MGRLCRAVLRGGEASGGLASELSRTTGVDEILLVSSGRAAMSLILETIRRADGDGEVLVPGYTCFSVAASAVRAGLRVRPLDISPDDLDFLDLSGPAEEAVAIVSANLYGNPNDLRTLEVFAQERGIRFIDDAAQALGATSAGRPVGSFGDVGIYSFDKGKNISTIQGGAIAVSSPSLVDALSRVIDGLPLPPTSHLARRYASVAAYAIFLRPWLYWLPNALLRLGETPFELDYPMTRYPGQLEELALAQLGRLQELSTGRRAIAGQLHHRLRDIDGLSFPKSRGGESVALRLPILLPDRATRDRVRDALVAAGVGATASYPRALIDVPEIRPHLAPGVSDTPRAREVAERILTLPTHSFVGDRDMDRMEHCIRREMGGGGSA